MTICYGRVRTLEEYSKWGSAAEVVASNYDLLSDILLRLPIKSLLRFRSVCKQWLSLIADSHFIRRKNHKCSVVSALYLECWLPVTRRYYEFVHLDGSQKRATLKSLEFAGYPHSISIVTSCKGLLFCVGLREDKYLVCNPTTNQCKTLPPLPGRAAMSVLGFNLAFDPLKSHVYKVVCICGRHPGPFKIQIFSSDTGYWGVSGASFTAPGHMDFYFGNGVYWNGAVHWAHHTDSRYFDMKEDIVRELPMLPLPDWYVTSRRIVRYLGESGGHLHLVDTYIGNTVQFNVLNVCEMEPDRSGWFVVFRVNLDGIAVSPWDFRSVMCVVREVKEEDSYTVIHVGDKIIRYNFKRRTHQVITNLDPLKLYWSWPVVFQYIPSLSPV